MKHRLNFVPRPLFCSLTLTARRLLSVRAFVFAFVLVLSLPFALAHASALEVKGTATVAVNTQEQLVVFTHDAQPLRVEAGLAHWYEPQGAMSVAEVHGMASEGKWLAGNPRKSLHMKPGAALWLRLQILRDARQHQLYLETQNPGLDLITLFWQDSAQGWHRLHSGDSLAVGQWAEPASKPLFALPAHDLSTQGNVQTVYLRIEHQLVPTSVPLTLIDSLSLMASHQRTYFLLGAYFGLAVVGLAWAAVRGVLRRDRVYLAYATLTFFMLVMQLSLTGVGAQALWSSSPAWSNLISFFVVPIYGALGIWFSCIFTQMQRVSLRLNAVAMGVVAAGLGLAVCQMVWHGRVTFVLSNLYVAVAMVVTGWVFIYAHWRGTRNALLCWMGFLPIVVTAWAPLARNWGWISTNFWTQYAMVIGAALEALILFAVLLKREQEAREAGVRAAAIAGVDPLTGAHDGKVLLTRLHESMLRCEQFNQRCALIRADLRNLDWFVKEHGAERAERAVVLTAAALLSVARDVDTVARVGRGEFALLVEGPVDAAGAMKAATQALARSLTPSDALPVGAQLQVHFAVSLLPEASHRGQSWSATEVWSWLCEQQKSAKLSPRNRVLAVNL